MKRNRAALVTSVSTAMLGAGWAAGIVGTAVAAQDNTLTTTIGAAGTQSPSTETSTGTPASPSPSASAAADPAAAATTPVAPAPDTAPASAGPSGAFQSATVQTRYGNYQVALTVDAGKITQVSMLQSGASDGTSRQIAASALPTLQQRVLSAQTYSVQGVSGASYTTQGFVAAVQNAMQAAGI